MRPCREFRLEQRFVGRLDRISENVFDDLVALVHRLLYQRIAPERADDVQPLDVGFVRLRELRDRRGIRVRKRYAERLDELARRYGSQPGDDAMTADVLDAVGGLGVEARRTIVGFDHFDARRRCAVAALELALLDRGENQVEISFLAARELVVAVDQDYAVLLGKTERVFDCGVSRADDHDGFVLVLLRVVELVLDYRQVLAGRTQLAQIALQADGEHDRFRVDRTAVGERDRERAALAGD